MATRIVVADVWVCSDCLQFAAGISEHDRGEPYPTDPAPWAEFATSSGHAVPTDGTVEFSKQRCQACGTDDAGHRHGAAWLCEEESNDPIERLAALITADPDGELLLAGLEEHMTTDSWQRLSENVGPV